MAEKQELSAALTKQPQGGTDNVAQLSTKDLLSRISSEATDLVRAEVELAKAELRENIARTKTVAEGVGAAALLALFGVNLALVAGALALALVMPAWAAALVCAGVLLAAAGVAFALGWGRRVKVPLETTRNHVKEDVKWVKERLS